MHDIKGAFRKGVGYSNNPSSAKALSYVQASKPYNFIIPIDSSASIIPKINIVSSVRHKELLERYYDNCYFYMMQSLVMLGQEKDVMMLVNNFNNFNTFIGFGEYKKGRGFDGIKTLYKDVVGDVNANKSRIIFEPLNNKSRYKYKAITIGIVAFIKRR